MRVRIVTDNTDVPKETTGILYKLEDGYPVNATLEDFIGVEGGRLGFLTDNQDFNCDVTADDVAVILEEAI